MALATVDKDSFLALIEKHGVHGTAKKLGINVRSVYSRRARIEAELGFPIMRQQKVAGHEDRISERLATSLANGPIVVGSDAHYWPGKPTTAHRAFVKLIKTLKPSIIVYNGDILDGASISRHPRIGWEERPSLVDELEACKDRLQEVREAAPKQTQLCHTIGNHDLRFNSRLANVVPEFAQVHGTRLEDHFPHWETCWSVWVNNDIVIKHRFKGGVHATHTNAMTAGKTMVTGHLHSLKVTPYSDYTGIRWGVDTGTLADPYGPQFSYYTEDGPVNWRSGFVVLTLKDSELLWPETVSVLRDGVVCFRGELIDV